MVGQCNSQNKIGIRLDSVTRAVGDIALRSDVSDALTVWQYASLPVDQVWQTARRVLSSSRSTGRASPMPRLTARPTRRLPPMPAPPTPTVAPPQPQRPPRPPSRRSPSAAGAGRERSRCALSQDQKDIRDWVHGFAADVVRPAAHEWDETRADAVADHPGGREDRPVRLRRPGAVLRRPDRPRRCRSSTRSCSGATPASACRSWAPRWPSRRSSARAPASRSASGFRAASARVDDVKVAAFCASEPNAGSDVSGVRTTRQVRRGGRASGCINGQKAWATNGGIADVHVVIASVDRELGSNGHAAFVVPMSEAKGISQGTKVSKHGLRASHTADVFLDDCRVPAGYVLGGKDKLDERLARVREGKKSKLPGGDADVRGLAPDGRRPGARHRPRRLRVRARVRQGARAVRAQDHREPGDRVHAGADEAGDRRGAPARVARLVDGPQPACRSRTPRAR